MTPASLADALFARVRALAVERCDVALTGVDYEKYEPGVDYFEHTEPLLRQEVASMTPLQRRELPDDDELWELLANEWFETFEARAAQRAP